MKQYLAITKALSDPSRVRMLCALRGGELCVCQLIELLGLAPSTVSKHLSVLNQAELVDSRKEGRWVYYRLPRRRGLGVAGRMTKETFRALADCAAITEDDERLKAIRGADLEELCQRN
jgi:ArsR family transcriptional regulator